ncbi:lipid-A-disaccharide synthase [Pandoraea thiooxydans]|uniref:Lipid-A-disaccharide synthase n=1 Tax=Pandoraea thiooxydans TaxID=445709 RepID=A0A0G3ES80_9BURK|nr:lipid-A-disaccharide synthase [Pandoraea thiooxydans]AKJ68207.1 lipid-A-disaccharide synthase [Pandoraea thiooxydans]
MTNPSGGLRLAMAAGEPSGDLLGGALLSSLSARLPADTSYFGIGGPKMSAAGFRANWTIDKLAVRGYVEVLHNLRDILAIRRDLRRSLLATPPDIFIGIDAPDFNFSVEETLRSAGVPVAHFVSPSIWAWRGGKIKKIRRAVDHMLCLFPFEPEIYHRAGVAATFVGHPLADVIPMHPDPAAARRRLGLPEGGQIVAVLPGSRRAEIALLAPAFLAAMALMQARQPGLRFVLPAASEALREQLRPLVAAYPDLALTITEGASHDALEAGDAVLLASGTATLEAALYKKPMVISYKVPWLTAQLMKRMGYLPYVGLPNVLAGRFVVPELLQEAATPEALAEATLSQLNDDGNRRALADLFTEMHVTLKRDAAARAADVIVGMLPSATSVR